MLFVLISDAGTFVLTYKVHMLIGGTDWVRDACKSKFDHYYKPPFDCDSISHYLYYHQNWHNLISFSTLSKVDYKFLFEL